MVQYTVQNNFNGGIISDSLKSRSDIEIFPISLADAENFRLTSEGVAIKRCGSKFVAKSKSSPDQNVILVQYSFSSDQNYILEMGNHYIRFYKDVAQILGANSLPYEIVSPYNNEEIQNLKYVFQNKKIYFVSGNNFPQVLSTNSDADWSFSQQELDGPYFAQRLKDTEPNIKLQWTKVSPDADGDGYQGEINNILANEDIFHPNDVGRSIQFFFGDITKETITNLDKYYHSIIITQYIDTKNVYGKWLRPAIGEETFGSGDEATAFHFSIFGAIREADETYPYRDIFIPIGFPSVIGTHENRLLFANVPEAESQRWGSCLEASKQTMNIDSVDCFYSILDGFVSPNDLAYSYDIKSNTLTSIKWFLEENGLIIETSKDELSVGSTWYSSSTSDNVTPNSSGKMNKNSSEGSNNIQGILFGNKTIFVSRRGKKLLGLKHNFSSNKYEVYYLSQMSKDILESGINSICSQRDIDPRIYCSVSDGTLPVLLENEKQSVRGWSRYTTDGKYVYANTLPAYSADKKSELWVLCKRSNSNEEFLSIEVMKDEDTVVSEDNRNLLPYSDCSIIYDGNLKSVFNNLDIFEGKEISILADGKVHPFIKVTNGSISLDYSANKVILGIPYNAYIKTLDFRVLSQDSYQSTTQLSLMQTRTVLSSKVSFSDTLNGVAGIDKDNLYTIPFRTSYDNTFGSLPLFQGYQDITIDNENDEHSFIIIGSETPTPMTINAIGLNLSPE